MDRRLIKQVNTILSERETAKKNLEVKIAQAKASSEEAERQMEEAIKNEDQAAYVSADAVRKFNNSVLKDATEELNNLTNIPKEEAEVVLNKIYAAMDKLSEIASSKAAGPLKTIYKIAEDLEADIDELSDIAQRFANESGNQNLYRLYAKRSNDLLRLYFEIMKTRYSKESGDPGNTLYEQIPFKNLVNR